MNFRLSCFAIISIALSATLACNQGKQGSTSKSNSPDDLIGDVERTLQNLENYQCDLELSMQIKAEGIEQNVDSKYDVRISKPDRWAIVLKSGTLGGSSVSDGRQITTYLPMMHRYSVKPITEGIDASLAPGLAQGFMMLGAGNLAPLFMGNHLKEVMLEGVTDSRFLENETIDGVPCRVARFDQAGGSTWKVWVEKGDKALVRRFTFVPDMSKLAKRLDGTLGSMELTVTLNFKDWETGTSFADDAFVFNAPEDATEVDSLFAMPQGSHEESHPLLGEQAPLFTTTDLEGTTVSLADHAGQDVVILDFWATWCGPCVEALPIISRVAEKFADRHVVLYAVNQGESADVIQEFLEEEDITVHVVMDEDSAIGDLYHVTGIPQTVLIDPSGRVQVVHVGFGGGLEVQLTRELEEVLAGKDLASLTLEESVGDKPGTL